MIATAYPVTGSAGNHPNTPGKMRSDQRPPGRFNGKRPFQQRQATPQRNQGFDSNGPTFKIRGSPYQIFERYVVLAREAAIAGDRVAAENFHQHADHYFRVSQGSRESGQQGTPTATPADRELNPSAEGPREAEQHSQPRWQADAAE